jgi:hypothetical protein
MMAKAAARYKYIGAPGSHEHAFRDDKGNVTERRFLAPGETLTEDQLTDAQARAFSDRFEDSQAADAAKSRNPEQQKAVEADAKLAEELNHPDLVKETTPVPAGLANTVLETTLGADGQPLTAGQMTADMAAGVDPVTGPGPDPKATGKQETPSGTSATPKSDTGAKK